MRLVFNGVPDIFSHYCQCLSEAARLCLCDLLSGIPGFLCPSVGTLVSATFGSCGTLCCLIGSSSFWLVYDTVPPCILGVSLWCSNFLTHTVLREYSAPSWDCTIKLFPCLLTTVCMGLGWTELRVCPFSPVVLIPGLQEVLLRVLHPSLSQHKICSYSSVRCPCHILLALHGHHSALEDWCVSFGQRVAQLGSHRLLGEVRLCKLQGQIDVELCFPVLLSTCDLESFQNWAILELNLPLAWGHLGVTLWCLIPCCTMCSETLLIWTAVRCGTSGSRVSHVVQTSLLGLRWP